MNTNDLVFTAYKNQEGGFEKSALPNHSRLTESGNSNVKPNLRTIVLFWADPIPDRFSKELQLYSSDIAN